jgi:uncharacterized protein
LDTEYTDSQLIEPPPDDGVVPEVEPAKRVWGLWPTAGFSLAIGFIILVLQIVLLLGIVVADLDAEAMMDPVAVENYFFDNLGMFMALTTVLSGILGTAAIVGVIKMRRGASITEYLGLRRLSFKTTLLVVVATLALIVAVNGLSLLVDNTVESDFDTLMYNTSVWPVALWLAVVVFAPLFEEVLFRGFLFAGIRDSRLGIGGAVVITSLVWAALHVQYNFYLMGIIFGMGLVLGVIRHKTKSIWSTLFIHFAFNLVAMLAIAFNADALLQ